MVVIDHCDHQGVVHTSLRWDKLCAETQELLDKLSFTASRRCSQGIAKV